MLSFGVVGCKAKMPEKTDENRVTESTPETKDNRYGNMTMESYKTEFGELYQTNMSRLENYNGYGQILVDKETKDYPGNEKYLEGLKKAYKDSEKNLQEFVDSLKKVKTEDPKLKEMNDKLIAQGNKVIEELKARSKKLENVPSDLMQKSEVDFRKGLDDLLKGNEDIRTDFNQLMKDAQESLGIDTNKVKK
jgi:hypothetical protein